MANSLADLYLRGGDQRAQTALSLADIAAQAQQRTGDTWGRAFATIGDTVSRIPGQIQQAKDQQFQREIVNEQRTAQKQAGINQARVNQIIAGFQTDPATGARTIPRDALQAKFAEANIPLDLQGQTLKALDAVDSSVQSFAKARIEHAADLANSVLASDVDLNDPQAVELAMAIGIGNGMADASVITQYNDAISKGMTPKAFFEQVRKLSSKYASDVKAFSSEQDLVDVNAPGGPQVVRPGTPKPAEPKLYPVTVDDGKGRPVEKLFTAEQLQRGVPAYRAPSAPKADEPLVAIMGPDGNPILVPRSKAVNQRPPTTREQPTEDERKSAGFYKQMQEAMAIMDETEGQLSQADLYQIQSLPQEKLMGLANRNEMSEAAKRYLRAFESFTEARMRPVSGAAISDSEFARDRRTYAKQYGETPKLAEDRKAARTSALESLKARASRALQTSGSSAVTVKGKDGQPYTFPNQKAADDFKAAGG